MIKKDVKEEVFVICEGLTEYKFLNFIKEKFDSKYKLNIIDAGGKERILREYKKNIKLHNKSKFCCVLDLDKVDTIENIRRKFSTSGFSINKNSIYFVNPNCELILALFKKSNPNINKLKNEIEKIFGIVEYDKKEKQLNAIFDQIKDSDVDFLIKNLNNISKDDHDVKSSNYYSLLYSLFDMESRLK